MVVEADPPDDADSGDDADGPESAGDAGYDLCHKWQLTKMVNCNVQSSPLRNVNKKRGQS